MSAQTKAEAEQTWFYWSGELWGEVTETELQELKPDIVCGRLAGHGALDPRLRLAVSDELSMQVAEAQHRRYARTNRGKR